VQVERLHTELVRVNSELADSTGRVAGVDMSNSN
jgi:hypothetical protein